LIKNGKHKKRDPRYFKSKAKKNSAKKAAEASSLKRRQLKEVKEREAGNREPSIDKDTGQDAQNNKEELFATEEPVEEPGQELAPEREPVLDQGPADEEEQLPKKKKRVPEKILCLKLSQRFESGWFDESNKKKHKMLMLKMVPHHLKIGEE
jgi:hypothetical protein